MDPYRLANQYERDDEDLNQAEQAAAAESLAAQGYEWETEEALAQENEASAEAENYYEPPEQSYQPEDITLEADLSDLEAEQREAERGKISLPEAIIVVSAAAFTDFFELITAFADFFPLAGFVSVAKGFVITAKLKAASIILKIISTAGKIIGLGGPVGKAISVAIKVASIPAKIILSISKALAAGLVAIGSALVFVGILWWVFTFSFGLIVSMSIVVWSIFRGAHYVLLRRLIIIFIGVSLDAATAGGLPTRTIAVVLAIWLNNKSANERIRQVQTKIENTVVAVGRIPFLFKSV